MDKLGKAHTTYVAFDGLGRKYRVADSSGESEPWNETLNTCFNSDGLVGIEGYPFQDTGWGNAFSCSIPGDTYSYDGLDRVTKVTHADGSYISTSYSGPCATVTDEASKTRESCTDGLGRLTEVIENPGGLNYTTNYSYDALGNLTGVVQNGSRNRTFVDDSLSRLFSASNPESGTTTYTYDADGHIATKTDARNITTTYSYDALNRVTQKTYSDGTPSAFFYYDASNVWGYSETNMVGRLSEEWTGTSCCATGGAEVFSYDPMGRVIDDYQWQPSAGFTIPYTYDLLGDVTSYGSGTGADVFTQSFNTGARVTQVTASGSDPNHPATLVSNVHYNAAGNVISGTFGNGLTETFAYNGRLQPCRSNVNSSGTALNTCGDSVPSGNYLDIATGYGSGDNGNVTSWSAVGAQAFNRSYTYDALNRLASMSAPGDQCTGLTWTYDAWGNRTDQTATGGTCDTFHQSVNGSNQFVSGYQYDADGNITYDGVHNYYYDAEDRIVQVDGTLGNCSTATACYLYDAQGRRTQKITGSNNIGYTYDLNGRVNSEWCQPCNGTYTGWGGGYVFLDGRMFAQYTDGTVLFTQTDHLGSTRLLTGYPTPGISACYDYYPFGEIISCGATGDQPQKFTGYLRDSETNLDDANARYFGSSLGRFMSPDPENAGADIMAPQSWNMYNYATNNPLSMTDPTGMDPTCVVTTTDSHANGTSNTAVSCTGTTVYVYARLDTWSPITFNLSQLEAIGQGALSTWQQLKSAYQSVQRAQQWEQAWLAKHPGAEGLLLLGAISEGDDPVGGDIEGNPAEPAADAGLTGKPSASPPADPTQPPGPGWRWEGSGPAGSQQGSWYNPSTGESLHPDVPHGNIGAHWDYKNALGQTFRVFPDGTSVPK